MGKDVNIEVPCLNLDLTPRVPEGRPVLKLHLVPVPENALAEVQEVLKKYQPEFEKFNEAMKKVTEARKN